MYSRLAISRAHLALIDLMHLRGRMLDRTQWVSITALIIKVQWDGLDTLSRLAMSMHRLSHLNFFISDDDLCHHFIIIRRTHIGECLMMLAAMLSDYRKLSRFHRRYRAIEISSPSSIRLFDIFAAWFHTLSKRAARLATLIFMRESIMPVGIAVPKPGCSHTSQASDASYLLLPPLP